MREIKFRGLDKKGIWHYGYLWKNPKGDVFIKERITELHYADFEIMKGTESQFTGLKDNNGKEIYEGDLISSGGLDWEIFWQQENCGFNKRVKGKQSFNPEPPLKRNQIKQIEITGNKFASESKGEEK